MLTPDEVTAMVRLHGLGWGSKRIAAELGCARNTVKQYVTAGGWTPQRRGERRRRLAGLERCLSERFRQHRGNCDVVRQDLVREHGIAVAPAAGVAGGSPRRCDSRHRRGGSCRSISARCGRRSAGRQ